MKRKQKSLSKPPQNIVGTHIHAQTPPTHMFLYILNVYTFVHLHHRLHAPTHVSRMGLQCIDANNDACIFSCALTCTHSLHVDKVMYSLTASVSVPHCFSRSLPLSSLSPSHPRQFPLPPSALSLSLIPLPLLLLSFSFYLVVS